MGILYAYDEPKDILYKLIRDGRKAHFSSTPEDMCDNIFNFCITGHSIRDWCIKYLQIDENNREAIRNFHEKCNENAYLKYCRDIANSSKHFGLRPGKPSTVTEVKSEQVTYEVLDGLSKRRVEGSSKQRDSAKVVLHDGEEVHLLMFLFSVLNGFKEVMDNYGIPYDPSCAQTAHFALVIK